jgi:hypothetical protein
LTPNSSPKKRRPVPKTPDLDQAESFNTSADSSTLNPPKNRSSTTRALKRIYMSQTVQRFLNGNDLTILGTTGDLR